MGKKITDKIREMLNADDQKLLEAAIQKMIDDRVGIIEEETKKKYDELAETYVTGKVEEELEKEKARLVEEYNGKLENLEKKIVSKLDSFLDHVITEQITDEAISKIAINEVLAPVVDGVKKIYAENFIELNSDGATKLKESQDKIKNLETQLSEAMSKIMESEERLEKTATYLLISEKTQEMTKTQRERVVKMFKDKHFDEVNEKIDTFIDIVRESSETPATVEETVDTKKTIDAVLTEGDHVEAPKPVVAEKAEENKTETTQQTTFAQQANRYM